MNFKTGFVAFTLVAIASHVCVVTACSNTGQSKNQVGNTTATNVGDKQMDHGGMMNHSMAMDLGPADANYDLLKFHLDFIKFCQAVFRAKPCDQLCMFHKI